MSLENLALKKELQSSFDASVKEIRKNLKDEDDKTLKKLKRSQKGLIRISNVPHGFFENEMRKYFQQFGHVTRVRLARSKKTGNSKGFAFVEFKHPDVAQVVAETMNNYLMFDNILKVKYIPPEEQKFDYFRGVVEGKVPKDRNRRIFISEFNRMLSQEEKKKFCEKATKQLRLKLKKLNRLGIDYEFKPVVKCNLEKKVKPVLTIDESDEEIAFKIPRNVKVVRKKSASKDKEEKCSKEKITEVNEKINLDKPADVAESNMASTHCGIPQHGIGKIKIKKRIRSKAQGDDDNNEASALKITNKLSAILKSKQRKSLNKTREEENCGSMALDSTKSTKISKPTTMKTKPRKSLSSMWNVKDCS